MKRFLLRLLALIRGRTWNGTFHLLAGGCVTLYADLFGRVWRKEVQWDDNGFTTMVIRSRHVDDWRT